MKRTINVIVNKSIWINRQIQPQMYRKMNKRNQRIKKSERVRVTTKTEKKNNLGSFWNWIIMNSWLIVHTKSRSSSYFLNTKLNEKSSYCRLVCVYVCKYATLPIRDSQFIFIWVGCCCFVFFMMITTTETTPINNII